VRANTETFALLGGIWKSLPAAVERARGWGADWADHSQVFAETRDGRLVAHVGVMEIAATIAGKDQTLAGIHAVCTHPDFRKQGLMKKSMERALSWVDERYERAVLWANDAAIYEQFGFVAHQESVFTCFPPGHGRKDLRALDLARADDLALLRAMLETRAPVSSLCGSRDPGWLFLIDLALWGANPPAFAHVPSLDCIVVFEIREGALRLYDVIAREMPSLTTLLPLFGGGFAAVEIFFTVADSPELPIAVTKTSLYDFFMVRGPALSLEKPFAFSPLSRC